jgi:anti-sigma-K factor RskA
MIDERMEEQASLYVLGVMASEEQQVFEAVLAKSEELQQLVAALRATRDVVAGSVPLKEPSPQLKQKILAQIAPPQKVPARSEREEPFSFLNFWLPWALATCLVMICSILFWQQGRLTDQLSRQAERLQALNKLADDLRQTTNSLQQTVLALRATNQLASLRIAMLNSLLADSPKAVAVSLWDNDQQKGVFVVQNLKPLPTDKDYQLWVMDPKYPTPVSAGVFQVDAQGNVRIQFTAGKPIASADKFAVTMEPKGGLPTPTLSNLVLLGS